MDATGNQAVSALSLHGPMIQCSVLQRLGASESLGSRIYRRGTPLPPQNSEEGTTRLSFHAFSIVSCQPQSVISGDFESEDQQRALLFAEASRKAPHLALCLRGLGRAHLQDTDLQMAEHASEGSSDISKPLTPFATHAIDL